MKQIKGVGVKNFASNKDWVELTKNTKITAFIDIGNESSIHTHELSTTIKQDFFDLVDRASQPISAKED